MWSCNARQPLDGLGRYENTFRTLHVLSLEATPILSADYFSIRYLYLQSLRSTAFKAFFSDHSFSTQCVCSNRRWRTRLRVCWVDLACHRKRFDVGKESAGFLVRAAGFDGWGWMYRSCAIRVTAGVVVRGHGIYHLLNLRCLRSHEKSLFCIRLVCPHGCFSAPVGTGRFAIEWLGNEGNW